MTDPEIEEEFFTDQMPDTEEKMFWLGVHQGMD